MIHNSRTESEADIDSERFPESLETCPDTEADIGQISSATASDLSLECSMIRTSMQLRGVSTGGLVDWWTGNAAMR